MFEGYDSSFNEYCSYCERQIIDNNSLYCSKDCQLKDLYINTNNLSRRAPGQYYGPQALHMLSAEAASSPLSLSFAGLSPTSSSYHDYSLSAINDANSPTSIRANSGSISPLSFPSTAHQFYKEARIKAAKDLAAAKKTFTYNPQLAPKMSPESAAYWKNVQRRNSFR